MRADAAANRRDLLDAGWRLLAQHGEAVSLRAVAAEAGVGIGTLYRHFPSREEFLLGVFGEVAERIGGVAAECLASWERDPGAAWSRFVHGLAELEYGALAFQMGNYVYRSGLIDSAGGVRERVEGELVVVLGLARAAGFLRDGVEVRRFFAGIAAITRPMPDHVDEMLPGQSGWLVDVFMRGLAP
ncbi:TetR/AcrR family transcriptional regulator [Leucobacter luti]|uniref:TetR/AcrR family transcriptional regulator n=1 Tax=Leucobacter luti TaxID=340320 RepID=UPI003D014AB5